MIEVAEPGPGQSGPQQNISMQSYQQSTPRVWTRGCSILCCRLLMTAGRPSFAHRSSNKPCREVEQRAFGLQDAFLPIRNGDSTQARAKTAVQSEHSLAFDNVLDCLVRGLFQSV